MAKGDQVAVRFYDSVLTSLITTESGVAIEVTNPKGKPPHVRWGDVVGGGRGPEGGDLGPGFEVDNEAGDRMTNMGGGGGNYGGRENLEASWGDYMPDTLRTSDRLTLRYVSPPAVLVLDEPWVLIEE